MELSEKKDMLKWEKLQLSLLKRISVIKMNVLIRMLFLFQTTSILITDVPMEAMENIFLNLARN